MISRRSMLLLALCILSIAIPVAYSKGRVFEGRRIQPESYIQEHSVLNSLPVVFVRTLVGGEPEILRVIASAGLLLTGVCVVSLGFDFAPKRDSMSREVAKATEGQDDEINIEDASD